jgi:hypothetical protein
MKLYRAGTGAFALLFIGIGVALLVETVIRGGSAGYLLGGLFIAAGTARLYLLLRVRR